MRGTRARSSPGVCGPRSSSSQMMPVSAGVNLRLPNSVLQKICWYFGTRLPNPDFSTTRVASREAVDDEFHGRLVQLHEWLAVALLIACIDEGIERQRVLIGRGDLLFDQTSR